MGHGPLQGALMYCRGICMHWGVSCKPLAWVCAQLRAERRSHDSIWLALERAMWLLGLSLGESKCPSLQGAQV